MGLATCMAFCVHTSIEFSDTCMLVTMGRADERSFDTATLGVSTPSMTSWRAGAQSMTEEKREGDT